jgi:hypothetical protein
MPVTSAALSWNGVIERIAMPAAGETVNSEWFVVPRGAKSVQIHAPALAAAQTMKIQALTPVDTVMNIPPASYTWLDVSTMDLSTAGTLRPLNAIPKSAVTTIPVTALGGGVLRFVSTGTESGLTIILFWSFDG